MLVFKLWMKKPTWHRRSRLVEIIKLHKQQDIMTINTKKGSSKCSVVSAMLQQTEGWSRSSSYRELCYIVCGLQTIKPKTWNLLTGNNNFLHMDIKKQPVKKQQLTWTKVFGWKTDCPPVIPIVTCFYVSPRMAITKLILKFISSCNKRHNYLRYI